jgi:hypothetical protein
VIRRTAGVAALLAVLLTACSSGDGKASPSTTARTPSSGRPCPTSEPGSVTDLSNEPGFQVSPPRWTDAKGCWVRTDVLATLAGPSECGWEDTATILMGAELGEPWFPDKPTRQYLRDPGAARGDQAAAKGYDADATLPAGATDSGFRRGKAQLWVLADDPSSVWLKTGSKVEQWPRWDDPKPCDKATNG